MLLDKIKFYKAINKKIDYIGISIILNQATSFPMTFQIYCRKILSQND